ncbi:hypothetical protein Q4574_05280 [Aliiglaciecola sp. 3_MG-2023]|uniref:hypothetical protein n=1 Tax=Aliiglaciecola sp. 3_MG-2023 TaxID=3062644 RepID=UPI0026E47436|nr:hypothetical protein [Aliiglaciecola sp. 3_MG-2023]MDO6692683.1 hypothetical protein [Aliiglaciecola sp. 3_MG-2023]
MEFINFVQLIILALIIVLLLAQKIAIKKGMLVEVNYSEKHRLSIALTIGAIPLVWGIMTEQYFVFTLGIAMGFICYQKKSWYKLKVL